MSVQPVTAAAVAVHRWSAAHVATDVALTPIAWRVWPPLRPPRRMEVPNIGLYGEQVAVEYLRRFAKEPDAARVGGELPVDLLSRRYAVEVKAGLVSNERRAQQWRLTFSEARGQERSRLQTMSAGERSQYFAAKQDRILTRKYAVLVELRRLTWRQLMPVTIALIVDAARSDVDLFWFYGWYQRIGWNTAATRAAYQGTFHVQRTD